MNDLSCGSLTHDIRTSISQEAYLSATFHYVDKNYRLCSRVLGLYHLTKSHKSPYITSKIKEMLQEWNIENKAINMKKALTDLDPLLKYFPCVGHKINSYAVNFLKKFNIERYTNCKGRNIINIKKFNKDDELRTIEITEAEARKYEEITLLKDKLNSLIAKCKSLVGLFRHREGLTKRLKEKQNILQYDMKIKLVQDVKTRWNLTYDLLD